MIDSSTSSNPARARCLVAIREREGEAARSRRYLILWSPQHEGAPNARARLAVDETLGPIIRARSVHHAVQPDRDGPAMPPPPVLPYASGRLAGVVCLGGLATLREPLPLLSEIDRVVAPGGFAYVESPFVHPHLGDDADSTRLTLGGVREALRAFDELDAGAAIGPGATLAWLLGEYTATWTNAQGAARRAIVGGVRAGLWPMTLLDRALARRRVAHTVSALVYFLGEKQAAPYGAGAEDGD